jgi:nitroreductase
MGVESSRCCPPGTDHSQNERECGVDRRQILIGGAAVAALGMETAFIGARQMGSSSDYVNATRAMRALLSENPETHDLIRYATLAPNGHNTQPWRFALSPQHITIRPDFARRTPIVDPDDHHLFVSLGCATENLSLAAAARGRPGESSFDEAGDGAIDFAYREGTAQNSPLFDAITKRQSTRAEYDGRAVSPADLNTLLAAATMPGIDVVLITNPPRMSLIRDLVIAANSTQMAAPAFIQELKTWLRFSPRQALKAGDGLYSAASGNPSLPEWLGPSMFDMLVTAKSENDKYARQLNSSAGSVVFVGAQDNREHWARAGRACQRFALQATALGLKHAFVNQPVEVAALRPELAALIGMPGRRPDLVMRFGYGTELPYSARRPVEAVLA